MRYENVRQELSELPNPPPSSCPEYEERGMGIVNCRLSLPIYDPDPLMFLVIAMGLVVGASGVTLAIYGSTRQKVEA